MSEISKFYFLWPQMILTFFVMHALKFKYPPPLLKSWRV